MLEETVCRAARIDRGLPGKQGEISGRVEGEGRQVGSGEDTGEFLLAVPKAVLDGGSTPSLEHIEGLVLDPRIESGDEPSSVPDPRQPVRRRCRLRPEER